MPNEQDVKVNLADRSYRIKVSWDLLSRAGEELRVLGRVRKAALISNFVVAPLHAAKLVNSLESEGIAVYQAIIPDGEDYKSLEMANDLYRRFIKEGIDRQDAVIALGGGVVGDLAGFVAATYMRGIPLVQIPTTLLAQVDSSVGGKTAVNLPEGKNLVGVFYQPRFVLIDPSTLKTLPPRELRSGLAEIIKTAFLSGTGFLAYLQNHLEEILTLKPTVMVETILRCCRFKAQIVEADERDTTNQRAILNFGHTIGHALEALTGYSELLHGEAVSIGMLGAALIAYEMGLGSKELAELLYSLITRVDLPVQLPKVGIDQIIDQIARDKKKVGDQINFVLLKDVGQAVVTEVPAEIVKKVLYRMAARTPG